MAISESNPCKKCGNTTDVWKDGSCAPCRRARAEERYKRNRTDPDKWEKIRKWNKEYRERKRLYEESPQTYTEAHRRGGKKRRKALKNATPDWLTPEQWADIECCYFKARYLTKRLETQYVVDHIVPLQGHNVCGLHVPWNLEVVTYGENAAKNAGKYHDSE